MHRQCFLLQFNKFNVVRLFGLLGVVPLKATRDCAGQGQVEALVSDKKFGTIVLHLDRVVP